jgi:hypothetical protein
MQTWCLPSVELSGRVELIARRLGLKPDWGELNVRNLRGGAGNVSEGRTRNPLHTWKEWRGETLALRLCAPMLYATNLAQSHDREELTMAEQKELSGPDFARGVALTEFTDGTMLQGHVAGEPILVARRRGRLLRSRRHLSTLRRPTGHRVHRRRHGSLPVASRLFLAFARVRRCARRRLLR